MTTNSSRRTCTRTPMELGCPAKERSDSFNCRFSLDVSLRNRVSGPLPATNIKSVSPSLSASKSNRSPRFADPAVGNSAAAADKRPLMLRHNSTFKAVPARPAIATSSQPSLSTSIVAAELIDSRLVVTC